MNILCMTCFGQKRKNSQSEIPYCAECDEQMNSFETREEMVDAIKDTKFILNKKFTGINSFSATEYIWSDLEMQRKRGHKVFSIDQHLRNSELTKMEIGVQYLELAKLNVLKRAS